MQTTPVFFPVSSPPPPPTPSLAKRLRPALPWIAAIVLLGALGIGTRWYFAGQATKVTPVANLCASDDLVCQRKLAMDAAAKGDQSSCQKITDSQSQAACYIKAAVAAVDITRCQELQSESYQNSCSNQVKLAAIIKDGTVKDCADLSDQITNRLCLNELTRLAKESGDCAKYGIDQSVCDQSAALKSAINSNDPKSCQTLESASRQSCLKIFDNRDDDSDGLSALKESEIGTSDTNSDTDGDSFSDQVEYSSGYNPLGI